MLDVIAAEPLSTVFVYGQVMTLARTKLDALRSFTRALLSWFFVPCSDWLREDPHHDGTACWRSFL